MSAAQRSTAVVNSPSRAEPVNVDPRPRILILNTRSTIYNFGSATDADSSNSENATKNSSSRLDNSFAEYMKKHNDFLHPSLPATELRQLDPAPLQGVDMEPSKWAQIAQTIYKEYFNFDGFVVIHGTDGMIYTASALSFMLKNLNKPIIFTGAIVPINFMHTDMKRNIVLALQLANAKEITEVCILFAERLFRANRCIKVARSRLQPFATPNFPPLATIVGKNIRLQVEKLLPGPTGRLLLSTNMEAKILTVTVTAGSFDLFVSSLCEDLLVAGTQEKNVTPVRAIVFCGFGTGSLPIERNSSLQHQVKDLIDRFVVVSCTQNVYGQVSLNSYDVGRQLEELGAISAGDMTIETTIVKLKYLFGLGYDKKQVQEHMLANLRGERTLETAERGEERSHKFVAKL